MNKNYRFIILAITCFAGGLFAWKHFSKPLPLMESLPTETEGQIPEDKKKSASLPELRIGSSTVTPDDLQWEIDLHSTGLKFTGDPSDKDIPFALTEESRTELRDRVVSSVLERKIGYLYITQKLKNFNTDDPARFTKCVSAMNEISKENPDFFSSSKSRERLKNKLCEQSVIEQYLEEKVFNSISVSPSEIASYYRTHEKEFKKPLRVTLRQIVVADESLAQRIRKEVKPSNFSELAMKYSITPEASKGGLIGPFSKEQLPTLFDIVFSMGLSEISGIVKSEFGYHIIMPVERHPAKTLTLAEASRQIREEFQRTKRLEAYQKWLSSAMNEIPVTETPSGI